MKNKWLLLILTVSVLTYTGVDGASNAGEDFTPSLMLVNLDVSGVQLAIDNSLTELALLDVQLSHIEVAQAYREQEIATVQIQQVVSRGSGRNSYMTLDLNKPSGLRAEDYDAMLVDTPLFGHGWIFEKAEVEEGVNGLFLMALTGQEQSFGAANTGLQDKNNLTSWNANDGAVHEATTFDSYWDCIQLTASKLKKNYLTVGGIYYNGPTLSGINVRYASDQNWDTSIANLMLKKVKLLN